MALGLAGIILLLFLLIAGVPLFFSMATVGLTGLALLLGLEKAVASIVLHATSFVSSYTLSVVPVFVLMGYLALRVGISGQLFDFAYKWGGRLPGGLAVAAVGAGGLFAAITGSSAACAAAIGSVSLPEMKKRNYDDGLATGCLAAAGTLGILIPPSIAAVIYAVVADTSVGKQLMAGVIPGVISMVIFAAMIILRCQRNSRLGPRAVGIPWKDSFRSIWGVWPILVVFGTMFGGIYAGIFIPTEAGAGGTLAVFIITVAKRGLNWNNFKEALSESIRVVGMMMAILIGASLFAMFITLSRLPYEIAEFVAGLDFPRMAILILILLPYLPAGMFIDSISLILITVPIMIPVVRQFNFDPVWFGILIVKLVEIGLITPPVAGNLFVIKGIAPDIPFETIAKGAVPFILADLVTLAILIAIPQLSLLIPSLM
ncbi:TRAP transporter large permease [Candidatus Omnitrophota bacterium]